MATRRCKGGIGTAKYANGAIMSMNFPLIAQTQTALSNRASNAELAADATQGDQRKSLPPVVVTWTCRRRRTTSSGMVNVMTVAADAAPITARRAGPAFLPVARS